MAANIIELTKENFENEVVNSSTPVMVDFWASWCMPCKMISPAVKDISEEYKGKCKVAKLNIDDAMEIAARFGVMNIPAIIFFKNGKESSRLVGVVSKNQLAKKINELLS